MGLQLVARLRGSGEPALEPLLRELLNGAHHSFTGLQNIVHIKELELLRCSF